MEIRNLVKKYDDKIIFDNFNLTIKEGEILAIMGASGIGKTTLLNIIAGLDKDYTGEIILENKNDTPAYIFQEPRLVKGATVLENVLIGSGFKDKEKAIALLEKLELTDYINEYPHKLSGGMAQRVSMARAFISGRSVLLMDEAFKGLDKDLKLRLYDLFKELWEINKPTTIIVTHDEEEAQILAHNIFYM